MDIVNFANLTLKSELQFEPFIHMMEYWPWPYSHLNYQTTVYLFYNQFLNAFAFKLSCLHIHKFLRSRVLALELNCFGGRYYREFCRIYIET